MKSTARFARKALITLAGVLLLAVGLAMLVLPGPGTLVIVLGFVVLATEYEWARQYSHRAREYARRLTHETVSHRWSFALSVLFALLALAVGLVVALATSMLLLGSSLALSGLLALGTLLFSYLHARRS